MHITHRHIHWQNWDLEWMLRWKKFDFLSFFWFSVQGEIDTIITILSLLQF